MRVPLSILDLTPVPAGTGPTQALANTCDLARHADRLDFHRYWLAEHHSTPGLSSSAPEVMIAHLATETSRMRIGSGGIMLPNHSPLRIAETFRVLAALHPGRIDLGIGRAPGGSQATAWALRRSAEAMNADLPSLLAEMRAYVDGGLPDSHPLSAVRALPDDAALPPVWILGSTEDSAALAASLGLGYAFAHHLGPRRAEGAMQLYRDSFVPSHERAEPYAILTVSAFCADDEPSARGMASSLALSVIRMRSGQAADLPTPEEAAAHTYSGRQQEQLERFWRAQIIGDAPAVTAQLDDLVRRTSADEVMVMTTAHSHEERRRSYELLANFWIHNRQTRTSPIVTPARPAPLGGEGSG